LTYCFCNDGTSANIIIIISSSNICCNQNKIALNIIIVLYCDDIKSGGALAMSAADKRIDDVSFI
jgi:hypothetical protein